MKIDTAWIDGVYKDLRYAVHSLVTQPAFTAMALLALVVGIALNVGVFTAINAIWTRPWNVPEPERVVNAYAFNPKAAAGYWGFSLASARFLNDNSRTIEGAFAARDKAVRVVAGGVEAGANASFVTGNYFDVLDVSLAARPRFPRRRGQRGRTRGRRRDQPLAVDAALRRRSRRHRPIRDRGRSAVHRGRRRRRALYRRRRGPHGCLAAVRGAAARAAHEPGALRRSDALLLRRGGSVAAGRLAGASRRGIEHAVRGVHARARCRAGRDRADGHCDARSSGAAATGGRAARARASRRSAPCCCSHARTSRICCSRERPRDSPKSPCAWRSEPGGDASSASCWSKPPCSLPSPSRSRCRSRTSCRARRCGSWARPCRRVCSLAPDGNVLLYAVGLAHSLHRRVRARARSASDTHRPHRRHQRVAATRRRAGRACAAYRLARRSRSASHCSWRPACSFAASTSRATSTSASVSTASAPSP